MHIYFIGIGGAGLSPLALMCTELGHTVSGSDGEESSNAQLLRNAGATVFIGHNADHIQPGIDLVIRSAAITPEAGGYVEVTKAQSLGIPVERREYLINQIAADFPISIGVCGTHGKTTTTSLLTHCLIKLNEDPSYIIGGVLRTTGTNANLGKKKFFIWEADEYSNAYHGVHVTHAILNNIEYDHPDFFLTEKDYLNSFKYFIENNVSNTVFLNEDDVNIEKLKNSDLQYHNKISFGLEKMSDYQAQNTQFYSNYSEFVILHESKPYMIRTGLFGKHNVYNTTAVFALLHSLGFESEDIIDAIQSFEGSERRFETLVDNDHIKVISDYAHHPTAIKTTIQAAKSLGYPVVAVFEPHQFARVKTLLPEYGIAFSDADQVLLLPIYASRDHDTTSVSSTSILETVAVESKKLINTYDDLKAIISTPHTQKTVYLCMSAGPLDKYLRSIIKDLQ